MSWIWQQIPMPGGFLVGGNFDRPMKFVKTKQFFSVGKLILESKDRISTNISFIFFFSYSHELIVISLDPIEYFTIQIHFSGSTQHTYVRHVLHSHIHFIQFNSIQFNQISKWKSFIFHSHSSSRFSFSYFIELWFRKSLNIGNESAIHCVCILLCMSVESSCHRECELYSVGLPVSVWIWWILMPFRTMRSCSSFCSDFLLL